MRPLRPLAEEVSECLATGLTGLPLVAWTLSMQPGHDHSDWLILPWSRLLVSCHVSAGAQGLSRWSRPLRRARHRPRHAPRVRRHALQPHRPQAPGWADHAEASNIRELRTFAAGLRKDRAAVTAGLTLPYSSALSKATPSK